MNKPNAEEVLSELNDGEKGRLAARKIKPQFPDSAEGQLMFAIVECAIKDFTAHKPKKNWGTWYACRESARRYLRGDIASAEICGVSADWISEVIGKCGINLAEM